MVVWVSHARVGHRQGFTPKPQLRKQLGFCFGRLKILKGIAHALSANERPFYAMTLRMAIMRASL